MKKDSVKDFIKGFIKGFFGTFALYGILMFYINALLWYFADESEEVFHPVWNILTLILEK